VIGTGAWMISSDPRWTAWRAILEGIFIAYSLIFVAAAMNPADFTTGVFNWYTALTGVMLITIFVFYLRMESQRRKDAL
jgi:FtsH-binding integral membrane protein